MCDSSFLVLHAALHCIYNVWLPYWVLSPEDPIACENSPELIMALLKLVTWNVRRLCAKPKCVAVLSHLKSLRADVSVLVETHNMGQMQMVLKKPWVGWLYHPPPPIP